MARLLDPRNGAAFDLPPCSGNRAYVVASSPRSGSTLLTQMMTDHGGVGAPSEYLNPMQRRDWEVRFGTARSRTLYGLLAGPAVGVVGLRRWSDARVDAHLRRVRHRRSSGGWFGLKLHWHHHRQFFHHRRIEAVLGPVTWVRIRRRDRLAQAVSWELARQTGRWVQEQPAWRLPLYRRDQITGRLSDLDAAEAGWDARLAGEDVIEVLYEDLAADPPRAVRGVLQALGAPVRPMPAARLRRMGSPNQVEWMTRYREG